MIVLALGLAVAQEAAPRERLADALLAEAVDGDLRGAAVIYDDLSKSLADDDPVRGDALYWLAHARWLQGDAEGARAPLIEGIRSGACPTRCRDLLERLELEAAAVPGLPMRWAFDDAEHGLFHPWRFQERGALRLETPGTLSWVTQPDPRNPDRLVMAFDAVGEVTSFTLRLSVSRDAALQVVVTDTSGDRFGLRDAWRVAAGPVATLTVKPADMAPVDGAGTLDATAFAELWLVDITPQGEPVRIDLDELSVR